MVTRGERRGKNEGGGGQGGTPVGGFPCFAVFGGPKITKRWEKQYEKCHCHTPFLCAPNASSN